MKEGKGKEGEGEKRREELEWEEGQEGRGGEEGGLGVDGGWQNFLTSYFFSSISKRRKNSSKFNLILQILIGHFVHVRNFGVGYARRGKR